MSRAIKHQTPSCRPLKTQKYSIVLCWAGYIERMVTYNCPTLFKIGQETLLDRIIEQIGKTFSKYEIILIAGAEINKIMRHAPSNICIVDNLHHEFTNEAMDINLGIKAATTDRILFVCGAMVCNRQSLVAPMNNDSLIFTSKQLPTNKHVGVISENGRFADGISYGVGEKWLKLLYLTGNELGVMKDIIWQGNNSRFGFEVVNEVIDRGGKFKLFRPKFGQVVPIYSSRDLEEAQNIRK